MTEQGDSMVQFIRKHGKKFDWPMEHTKYTLHNSVYYGFWLRLKKLGFELRRSYFTFRNVDNVIYFQTSWSFYRPSSKETVILMASRNLFILTIFLDQKRVLREKQVCYTRLEMPFLAYFQQTNKPLFIPRLGGNYGPTVQKFIKKWQRHVANGGKHSALIKRLNILPPLMPKDLYKK